MPVDYYKLLEIDHDASQADVKKAYRRLARKYHPDANKDDPSAADKFRKIKEAFDILSDPLERDKYDHYGPAYGNAGSPEPPSKSTYSAPPPPPTSEDVFSPGPYDDIRQVPRQGSPQPSGMGPQPGADLRYDLEITFEESIFGLETEIYVPIMSECNICQGTGIRPGAPQVPCRYCNGRGEVRQESYGNMGGFVICENCQGTGISPENLCYNCQGSGRNQSQRSVYVKVPPGVENGARLRIRGMGEPGSRGGPPGDLYVMIYVLEHDQFERHGDEILCETTVTILQAALGAEIEVPTIDGKAKMKIPPGTQTGTIFRLRGKGVPNIHTGQRGDQHVKVTVVTPSKLSRNGKELLWKFGKEIGEDMSSILWRKKR